MRLVTNQASGFTRILSKACAMKSNIIATVSISVMLAACGETPSDLAGTSDAISNYLQSPTTNHGTSNSPTAIDLSRGFASALLLAVNESQRIQSAKAIERDAFQQANLSRSLKRPQVAGNANIGATQEIGDTPKTASGVAASVNLSQLVYDGGASNAAISRAMANAFSAQASRIAEGNEVALEAGRAWIAYWQYSERLRLLNVRTSEMALLLEQIERVASNGMLDRAALDSARGKIVEIELEEVRLQAGYSEARVMFERYFGLVPNEISPPAELISIDEARNMPDMWRNAPILQRQVAEMLASQAAVSEAEAAFQPVARLQAGARTPLDRADPTNLSLGVSLEYTLGDGGRRQSQLDSAKSRHEALIAKVSATQSGLQAELDSLLLQIDSIERSLPLLEKQIKLSQSEAETSRSQLLTGQSNLRQLIEAEVAMYRTQDQQIALQAERHALLLTLAARTGSLSELIEPDE